MKRLSFLLLTLFLVSCLNSQFGEGYKFGSSYNLVTTSKIPSIQNDSLISKVTYGGCEENHNFILKNHISNDRAEVWLFKQTPDQPCEMLIQERKSFRLKNEILEARNIILIKPNEDRMTLK